MIGQELVDRLLDIGRVPVEADRFRRDLAQNGARDDLGQRSRPAARDGSDPGDCPGSASAPSDCRKRRDRTRGIGGESLQPRHAFRRPRLLELADERPGTIRRLAFHRQELGRRAKLCEPFLGPELADQAGDRRVEMRRSPAAVRSIHAGRDEHQPEHASGIPQRDVDGDRRTQRDPADDRLFDLQMIEEGRPGRRPASRSSACRHRPAAGSRRGRACRRRSAERPRRADRGRTAG